MRAGWIMADQEKSGSWEHYGDKLSVVGLAAFGALLTGVVAKLVNRSVSLIVMTLLALLFAILARPLVRKIQDAYKTKRLRRLTALFVLIVGVILLGWPWPRVQAPFKKILLKAPVSDRKWMSEGAAEKFVINKLRERPGRTVLVQRARWLMYLEIDSRIALGRYKCEDDSLWVRLDYHALKRFSLISYDGTHSLSEVTNCIFEYSTDVMEHTDWLASDSTHPFMYISAD